VRDIQLTATYDEKNQEFVMHSPSFEAYKWWIGGAAKTANMSCVFAQLYVKGISQGVHCFLVNIRDKATHLPLPGVLIGDCGPKVGNEVIDNGFIGFNKYRIPREALLDRYSTVSEDGNFSSPITNPDTRFATVLGALEEGRITIAAGSQVILLKISCLLDKIYFMVRIFIHPNDSILNIYIYIFFDLNFFRINDMYIDMNFLK